MSVSSLSFAVVSVLALFTARANQEPRPRVVAFGDSLTSGHGIGNERAYPAILQKKNRRSRI
jgi:hypothetical protein